MKEVILIHGDFQNKSTLKTIEKFLRENGLKTHNINLPGHGDNNSTENPQEFLKKYIKENNIEKPTIIGHSFGSIVAANHSLNNPTNSLILINAPLLNLKELNPNKDWETERKQIKELNKKIFEGQKEIDYSNTKDKTVQELQIIGLQTTNPETILNHFKIYEEVNKIPEKINCPTLLINSTRDHMIPLEKAKKTNQKIKNSKMEIINSGHNSPIESAEEIIKILKKNPNYL